MYYTDCNQKLECTSYISSTSTDNHDTEYQPTSSKLQRRSEPTLLSPRNITLPLASIGGSHSTCFVCKKRGPKLIVASASVRFNCFLYNNIIVPAGSRCCPSHVNNDAFTDQAIHMMSNCRPNTDFNRTEIVDMFLQSTGNSFKQQGKRNKL